MLQCRFCSKTFSRFWDLCFGLEEDLSAYNDIKESSKRRFLQEEHALDQLRRQNILNESFFIDCTELFGTINGQRMGTLQSITVCGFGV